MSDATNETPRVRYQSAQGVGSRDTIQLLLADNTCLGVFNLPHAERHHLDAVCAAFNNEPAALGRIKTLEFILLAILPPDRTDERIGWRGVLHEDKNQFSCEFCAASHLDFTQIWHAQDCPVARGRAALAGMVGRSDERDERIKALEFALSELAITADCDDQGRDTGVRYCTLCDRDDADGHAEDCVLRPSSSWSNDLDGDPRTPEYGVAP